MSDVRRNTSSNNINDPAQHSGFVRVHGAGEHNLKNVDVDVPRDAVVVSPRTNPLH